MKKNMPYGQIVHTKKQIFGAWFAFIALFVCGVMVGTSVNDVRRPENMSVIQMTESQCNNIASQMTNTSFDAAKLAELNKIYSENCAGRLQPKRVQPKPTKADPQQPCEIVENVLLAEIDGPYTFNYDNPYHDIKIYQQLINIGCPENQEKYYRAIDTEEQIIGALMKEKKSTCEQIEVALLEQLPDASNYVDDRLDRAKIYANLSERGCPVNSQKYVELSKQELEIARALQDDKFSEEDTIEVVETYKRLNMQAAAQEIFETAKKLTDPAIDFILEIEKIINEK